MNGGYIKMRRSIIIENTNKPHELLIKFLGIVGMSVDIAEDYADGFLKSINNKYDFYFIEIDKTIDPEDSAGFKLCEHLRKISILPIIYAISNYDDLNILRKSRIYGFDDFFVSPFNLTHMDTAIKNDIMKLERWEAI